MHRALTATATLAAEPGAATRRITALIVPWNTPAMVTDNGTDFYRETFAPGSLFLRAGVPVTAVDDHNAATGTSGPVVGEVVEITDTPAGLEAVLEVAADAPVVDTVAASLDAGDPLGVSIEFEPLGNLDTPDPAGGIVRRAAVLTAVALATATRPQYRQARVLALRATTEENPTVTEPDPTTDPTEPDPTTEENPTVTTTTATDATPTADPAADPAAAETARRAVAEAARGGATATPRPALLRFRSLGHFAAEVAAGKVTAPERERISGAIALGRRALAATDTTTGAGLIHDQWVTDVVDFIGAARPFIDAFHTMPLPSSGMSIKYPKVTTRPSTAKQAAELDEVSSTASAIGTGDADVETYAGGEQMSLQLARRSDPSYLELVMELYTEEMAADMDSAAITAALAAIGGGNALAISAATDLNTGLNARLVAGAKQILSGRVGRAEVLVAGLDVWEVFANALDDNGRPLYPEIIGAGGEPGSGTIALDGGNGRVRSLEFVPDANMTATKAVMGWRRAFTTMLGPVETLAADTVGKLGREVAVFQMAAFLARRPTAAIEFTLGA